MLSSEEGALRHSASCIQHMKGSEADRSPSASVTDRSTSSRPANIPVSEDIEGNSMLDAATPARRNSHRIAPSRTDSAPTASAIESSTASTAAPSGTDQRTSRGIPGDRVGDAWDRKR